MAYSSGLILTGNGYEQYNDKSGFAIDIANKLLKTISQKDFNPGQQTIASNTRFMADVQHYWSLEYYGIFYNVTSEIQSYSFSYDCPHEEAISDTLAYIVDEVENTIYTLLDEGSDTGLIGDDRVSDSNQEYFNAWNRLGLFI